VLSISEQQFKKNTVPKKKLKPVRAPKKGNKKSQYQNEIDTPLECKDMV